MNIDRQTRIIELHLEIDFERAVLSFYNLRHWEATPDYQERVEKLMYLQNELYHLEHGNDLGLAFVV